MESSAVLLDYSTLLLLQKIPGGALVFKGGYHARVQKHGKRVVFHGEARAARPVFRVSKTAEIKKKGMFFKAK